MPAAPDGWNGPVARLDDTDAPDVESCGGAFPVSVSSGATNVEDPGTICDCTCAEAEGGACSSTINVGLYNVVCSPTCNLNYGSCANVDATFDVGPQNYIYVDEDTQGIRLLADAPAVLQNPSCEAVPNHVMPEVQRSGHLELCAQEAALEETCVAGQVCVPDPINPFASGLCILADGDMECPAGEYASRQVLYRDVEDTRSCSECSCGSAQNVACEGEVGVSRSWPGHAKAFSTPYPADGTCTDRIEPDDDVLAIWDITYAILYDPPDPSSTGCPPSGGAPSGSVNGIDPVTVCCTAE